MKKIDLHTHTTYSDGELTPQQLIELAKKQNIEYLGISDHYTIRGLQSLKTKQNITLINGVELSGDVKKGKMHILGYDFNINDETLNKELNKLRDNSINNVLSIIEQIKKDYNIIFGYDDIKEMISQDHNLNRVDVARLCVENGYAETIQQAFQKYLIDAFEKTRTLNKRLTYEETIELIRKSGGIPVLAHPKSLEQTEIELLKTIKELIKCGLQGIEVYHSSHTEEETKLYLEIAHKYNLLISGGSDYHGPTVKPNIELGTGENNNLHIKQLSILEEIKHRRGIN